MAVQGKISLLDKLTQVRYLVCSKAVSVENKTSFAVGDIKGKMEIKVKALKSSLS